MSSAEGQVQNLKYKATFPLLLNISGEPTYFIALKDDAGLVKKYAMVNVQRYQIVAIGDSVSECEDAYTKLMYQSGIKEEAADTREVLTAEGKISKIAQGVVDGNSHYYIMLEDDDQIYDISVVEFIDVIRYDVGDTVKVEYKENANTNMVLSLTGSKAKDEPGDDAEKEPGNVPKDENAPAEEEPKKPETSTEGEPEDESKNENTPAEGDGAMD